MIKKFEEFVNEAVSPYGSLKMSYKEMEGLTAWEESFNTNAPMNFKSLYAEMKRHDLSASSLTDCISEETIPVFTKILESSDFKNKEHDFQFYTGTQRNGAEMLGVGCNRHSSNDNYKYPVFRVDLADRLVYWLKDNLKNCVKFMEKHCK